MAIKNLYSVYQYGKWVDSFSSRAAAKRLAWELAREDGAITLKGAGLPDDGGAAH